MKVKMKVALAGNGVVHEPGDEIDVPAADAGRLIARGMAAKVPGENYKDLPGDPHGGLVETARIDHFAPGSPVECAEAKCHTRPRRKPAGRGEPFELPKVSFVPFVDAVE